MVLDKTRLDQSIALEANRLHGGSVKYFSQNEQDQSIVHYDNRLSIMAIDCHESNFASYSQKHETIDYLTVMSRTNQLVHHFSSQIHLLNTPFFQV